MNLAQHFESKRDIKYKCTDQKVNTFFLTTKKYLSKHDPSIQFIMTHQNTTGFNDREEKTYSDFYSKKMLYKLNNKASIKAYIHQSTFWFARFY